VPHKLDTIKADQQIKDPPSKDSLVRGGTANLTSKLAKYVMTPPSSDDHHFSLPQQQQGSNHKHFTSLQTPPTSSPGHVHRRHRDNSVRLNDRFVRLKCGQTQSEMFTNSVHSRNAHPDANSREDFALAAIVARDNRDKTPDSGQLTSTPTFASMGSPEHSARTSCLLALGKPNSLQGTDALLDETLNSIGTKTGESQSRVSRAEQRSGTSSFVSVNKPAALPSTSRLNKVDYYESSCEDANDDSDDSEDHEDNDDIADVKASFNRKIHVKDPKEIRRVGAAWWTMSEQDRAKYKLTQELRDAIWKPHERAHSDKIAEALWNMPPSKRISAYSYAFDSSGHPYAEYRRACEEHPKARKREKSSGFSMHAERRERCAVHSTIESDPNSLEDRSAAANLAAEQPICVNRATASNNQMASPNEATSREQAGPVPVKEELGDDHNQS